MKIIHIHIKQIFIYCKAITWSLASLRFKKNIKYENFFGHLVHFWFWIVSNRKATARLMHLTETKWIEWINQSQSHQHIQSTQEEALHLTCYHCFNQCLRIKKRSLSNKLNLLDHCPSIFNDSLNLLTKNNKQPTEKSKWKWKSPKFQFVIFHF